MHKTLLLSINALCASIVWAQAPASLPAPSQPSAQSKLSVHWEELTAAGTYRVYDDPADLLAHLDELGIRT